ncbi:MAG: FAD-dependent oxidoreductase [Opitutaceae bacterium]|jgi:2-polyprenyl-6-methoxyphenol hydroxylase-like FAD-dependent oxidoreductase|nr:FAD-dependent oxidoreductase [Opitutaceae bacterium]
MISYRKNYDAVVAGAGVAGVAASLELARAGLNIALVEKNVMLGGLATAGFVHCYLPLCDGEGTQASFGIAEELLHATCRYGIGRIPPDWRQSTRTQPAGRYMVTFSPAAFALALDELVAREPGIDLWYDTLVCAAAINNGRITAIEVENKSGRGVLAAPVFIDTTGDGDVARRAGCAFVEEGNKLTIWAMEASLADARHATEKSDGTRLCHASKIGLMGDRLDPATKLREHPWRGTDGKSVSRFIAETHAALLRHYAALQTRGGDSSRENCYPLVLPAMAQFRTTRAITGRATLAGGMEGRRFEDSIALAADWRRRGGVLEIPYGTMIPETVAGLIVAGRCISSTGDAWEITRSIGPSAQTGQVAGLAATLAFRSNTTPGDLAVAEIQSALREKGMPCHFEEARSLIRM